MSTKKNWLDDLRELSPCSEGLAAVENYASAEEAWHKCNEFAHFGWLVRRAVQYGLIWPGVDFTAARRAFTLDLIAAMNYKFKDPLIPAYLAIYANTTRDRLHETRSQLLTDMFDVINTETKGLPAGRVPAEARARRVFLAVAKPDSHIYGATLVTAVTEFKRVHKAHKIPRNRSTDRFLCDLLRRHLPNSPQFASKTARAA